MVYSYKGVPPRLLVKHSLLPICERICLINRLPTKELTSLGEGWLASAKDSSFVQVVKLISIKQTNNKRATFIGKFILVRLIIMEVMSMHHILCNTCKLHCPKDSNKNKCCINLFVENENL